MTDQEPKRHIDLKSMSRREFLKLPFQGADELAELLKDPEKRRLYEELKEALKKAEKAPKIKKAWSRRSVLKAISFGLIGGITSIQIDNYFLRGRGQFYLREFLTNADFRNKFFQELEEGDIGDKLETIRNDLEQKPNINFELGEKLPYHEDWLDKCYLRYEVRALKNGDTGEKLSQLVLVADIDKVKVVQSVTDQYGQVRVPNFTKTVEKVGPIATLPEVQVDPQAAKNEKDETRQYYTPRLWQEFKLADGSVHTVLDIKSKDKNVRAGAIIVLPNNKMIVVDQSEALQYSVTGEVGKKPAIARDTIAFSVNSKSEAEDLESIDNTYSYTANKLSKATTYYSCLVSFTDESNNISNVVISIYNYFNPKDKQMAGGTWKYPNILSIQQVVKISHQLMKERGYKKFILAGTDPDLQSKINGPDPYSNREINDMLRGKSKWAHFEMADQYSLASEALGNRRHRSLGNAPVSSVHPTEVFLGAYSKK